MKLRYKILIVTAIIAITAIIAVVELFNFMGGPSIRRIKLPHGSTQLSIVTDGFQDRTSSVYLSPRLWLPRFLFDFDPYGGGVYSFDVSGDGKIVRFQQSGKTSYIRLDDSTVSNSAPTGDVRYQTLIEPTTKQEVDGTYLWSFQYILYRR